MKGLPQFLTTISKFKLTKSDDLISIEKSASRSHPIGFLFGRALNICSQISQLFKEIYEKIPLTPNGGQPIISQNHEKIYVLLLKLFETAKLIDTKKVDSNRYGDVLESPIQYFFSLKDSMLCLGSSRAPSMAQILGDVQKSIQYVDGIVSNIQNSFIPLEQSIYSSIPVPQTDQQSLYHSFAATLVALENLSFGIISISAFDSMKQQNEPVHQWINNLFSLGSNLQQQSINDSNKLALFVANIKSQMLPLSNFISTLQPYLVDKPDFVKTCLSLSTLIQCINEFELKLKNKELNEIIKTFASTFLSGKPLNSLLESSVTLLNTYGVNAYGDALATYKSLLYLSQICSSDQELSALVISSICRFCSTLTPDFHITEELLNFLTLKITEITKSIYSESRQIVLELIKTIDSNLEFFNDEHLGEVNYVLTGAKNIMDFVPTDPHFTSQQQLFFDALGSLPSPLSKLLSTCIDSDTKSQLTTFTEKISNLSNRYSKWVVQFYLSTSAVVINRSENILYLLSYPVMMLSSLGMQQYLTSALESLKSLQSSLQITPQFIVTDLAPISKLIEILSTFSAPSNQFIEIANRNNESIYFPIYKAASTSLSKAITTLPPMVSSLSHFSNFTNNESLVCSLTAVSSRALAISQEYQQIIDRCDPTALFFFSTPFILTFMCEGMLKSHQSYTSSVQQYTSTLKSALDIIWPIAKAISSGIENKEKANLPTYTARYITSLSELSNSISQLPRPSIPYKIPDDIQEIKKFDSMADSIHSSLVKSFAKYIVKTLKRSKSSDVRSILTQWFEATQVQTGEVNDGSSKLESSLLQLITSATTDRSQFIESFASLSVSLAATEYSYGKTVSPFVSKLHKDLVFLVQDMLENIRSTTQVQLMKISSVITQIKTLAPISKLKPKEFDSFSSLIISKVIQTLNILRTKTRDATIHDFISSISSLSEFEALLLISPQEIDVKPLLTSLFSSKFDNHIDKFITLFSEKLMKLEPSQFILLGSIRDTDTVCDHVYDKAELFRDEVNEIINISKTPLNASSLQICESLKKMMLYFNDSAVLTMHSLMLGGLAFTPLSRTLVECFSELTISFYEFVSTSFKIPNSKDDLGQELRRINRKMSKQFDTLINIVENPQRSTSEVSEFEALKNQMYADLSTVSIQIARLMSLSSTALVPEMWTITRNEIIDTLTAAIQQLFGSVSTVRSKAVGATSTELGGFISKLDTQLPNLVNSSTILDFSAIFPPVKILPSAQQISTILQAITKISPSLTDRIVIEPDHASASKVPDTYTLPPLPEKSLSPTDALDEMELAKRHLDQEITSFKNITDGSLSSSGELLSSLTSLRKAANTFAEKALSMARATVETRSQVEQQTNLHGFSNSVTQIHRALKSRLLRSTNFSQEMDEAILSLRNSTESSMRIAIDASKIEVEVVEDESMDEVTRELMATSKAIEDMTSRLSQFASQVDMESVSTEDIPFDNNTGEISIPDIGAISGTLPAFLISSAQPILQATAKIVIRAREITIGLIQKFGKIDNESGMIKCAQDLSEAAELLIICAEILVNANEPDAEFKVIAASRIIKGSVSALVATVLVKGGDSEGIMNQHVKVVVRHTDTIIKAAEKIIEEKLNEEDSKQPKKVVKNPMIQKLNMQQQVNQLRKSLQDEEKNLYQFRRRGNK